MISEDDFRTAAQYLIARTSRKKLERIAKVIKKADAKVAANGNLESVSEETIPDDEWLDYCFDKCGEPSADEVREYKALLPDESELMLLQDIGLFSVAYDNDECVVFTGEPTSFHVEINGTRVWSGETYSDSDGGSSCYVPTGAVRFMTTGLCVYKAIAGSMDDRTNLLTSVVRGYYKAADSDRQ